MNIQRVGVVGCGQMGGGIVQVFAQAGFPVVVLENGSDLLERGISRIAGQLARAVEKGKLPSEDRERVLARITGTLNFSDFANCDLVIEAIVERMEPKREVFATLERVVKPGAILASNTSSLAIMEIAVATNRPDRVAGMHFFNPVPVMPIVEVVRTIRTSDETIETIRAAAGALGKSVVLAKDTPGFIVNLLLIPYLLDAIRACEQGVASRDDIDTAMKLGCGLPMGPLTLADFIGLDTVLWIGDVLLAELHQEKYAAPPLLRRMVTAGLLGRKSGRGFYDYA
ncbi:MAG TPA: 3-hydroxybutyryl-CoA dehydrogenase [Chloroflexota bacterium]|nr:3-hydroxybutyryl-CoA dehydrogenase [Chloroflexota bacterium]